MGEKGADTSVTNSDGMSLRDIFLVESDELYIIRYLERKEFNFNNKLNERDAIIMENMPLWRVNGMNTPERANNIPLIKMVKEGVL